MLYPEKRIKCYLKYFKNEKNIFIDTLQKRDNAFILVMESNSTLPTKNQSDI